jgi:hypothetical protein
VKITYLEWNPGPAARDIIATAETICRDYATQGYDLTLRQLYYQFVARALIPNSMQSYKRLGDIVNQARLAGMLDWSYIVDRTRNLRGTSHWGNPSDIIDAAARSFRIEKWADQPTRVEVWVEKDALAGVIERAAAAHDVDWFACRGYVSQSELWAAGQRLARYMRDGQDVVVLHLGDHDPSGIDMTRDIRERLEMFIGRRADTQLEVRRIALNMDQVRQYNLPPNPAKLTDSRAMTYIAEHGRQSWELDALDPATLNRLISDEIEAIRDEDLWDAQLEQEGEHRRLLTLTSQRWPDLTAYLDGGGVSW